MLDKQKLLACKQKIDEIKVIFEDGTTAAIPSLNITFMSIEKNFFNDFFPIFCIKAMVDYKLYKKLNTQKCIFNINIYKFFIRSDSVSFNKNNIVTKNFINDIFVNTNNGDTSPDLYNGITDKTTSQPTDFEKSQMEIELFLFQKSAMDYTALNNNIFKSCTVSDAIIGLVSVTGQRPILMTYPNNLSLYGNIIIPNNLTFLGCIDFLQAVYGIYNHGYCLFSDYDALYLVDKLPKCNAYRLNETKNIFITFSDKTQESGNIYGCYEDYNSKCYVINCTSLPTIIVSTDSRNEILAENVNTVNTTNQAINVESFSNTKIIDNKYSNNYSINTYKYEKSLCTELTVDIRECDLDMFKINKEYHLSFDITSNNVNYRNCDGLYKLMSIQAAYIKKDDSIFENTIRIKFIRA